MTVRGAATGGRLGIADPTTWRSLEFFWPTPDQAGTEVDAGEAFGNALRPTSRARPACDAVARGS